TVLDRAGTVLARFPDAKNLTGKSLANDAVVKRMLDRKDPIFEMPGTDGIASLHAISLVDESILISVSIPLSVSLGRANETLARNITILGLVAIFILVVSAFYARRAFLWPVNSLAAAARRLASGDLKARAGKIGGSAELAQLGKAFDDM